VRRASCWGERRNRDAMTPGPTDRHRQTHRHRPDTFSKVRGLVQVLSKASKVGTCTSPSKASKASIGRDS
jgi:hypothetical protein